MSDPRIKEEIGEAIRQEDGIDEEYEDEFIDLLDAKYRDLEFGDDPLSLTRMEIEGFKAITELDVTTPDRATILHGRNSKGKSSFIEATRFNLFGRDDDNPLITKPINRNYEKLKTDGYWRKADRNYLIHREMERKQGFEGHRRPNVIENPEESKHSEAEQRTQSEVDDLIGITPLYERGFDRFKIFSLFSIISGDLRSFFQWDESANLIDLLFGIKLTSVDRAITNELEECKLEDEEREAKTRLLEYKQRATRIDDEIQELRLEQKQVENQLSDKVERREELSRILDKSEVDSALSEKIDLKDEISDLQSRLQDKEDGFLNMKQEISKLKDETATEEIAPALQEVQQLISLPNRCPICTRDVDPEKQEEFNEHGDCPLCGKEVPDVRHETVSEVDEQGELIEQEKRQEELEELESQRRTIEGEIEFLEEELEEKRDQLEIFEEQERQSGFTEYKREKEKLEYEIEDFRDKNTSIELSIDSKKEKLHGVARQVWEWGQTNEERQRKEQRSAALDSFESIIIEERKEARRRLKNRFEERMESLLSFFTRGTFEEATGVRFSRGDSYDYTIYRADNTQKTPGILGQTDAELLLHMLVFHTTILAELEEERETIPIKLLSIDSPYGNGLDNENAADVTDFLLELPEILDSYQLIIAMADSNLTGRNKLEDSYTLEPVEQHI
jgi:DNA repair exonuclease SbcCD ATPase subunit